MMDSVQTRADLRRGHGRDLECRRAIAGLAICSNAILSGIALFQMGILKGLPARQPSGGLSTPASARRASAHCVAGRLLAISGAETVNGSIAAYRKGVPDALLGMASYAMTALLAGYGPADRAAKQPWIPVTLAAKVVADAAMAAAMSRKSWRLFGRFSLLSMLVAGATFLALPLALPEARRAFTVLHDR